MERPEVAVDDWVRYSPYGSGSLGASALGRVVLVNEEFCVVDSERAVWYDQIAEVRKPPPSKVLDTDIVFNVEQS